MPRLKAGPTVVESPIPKTETSSESARHLVHRGLQASTNAPTPVQTRLGPLLPEVHPLRRTVAGMLVRDVSAVVDRARAGPITPENAQTLLNPDACLFIAK